MTEQPEAVAALAQRRGPSLPKATSQVIFAFDQLHPVYGKCEWRALNMRRFLKGYNEGRKTGYVLGRCLDVHNRAEQEPEFLLTAKGKCDIVIEAKSVIWPPRLLEWRQHESWFHDVLCDRLRDEFDDGVYIAEVHEDSLKGRVQHTRAMANGMAERILRRRAEAKAPRGLRDSRPVPWLFRPAAPGEFDGYQSPPHKGIVLLVSAPALPDSPEEVDADRDTAIRGFAASLGVAMSKAVPKLAKYPKARRMLFTQFFGEGDCIEDDDIVSIVRQATLPKEIDEVWVAYQEWISADEYEVAWKQVRTQKASSRRSDGKDAARRSSP